MSERESNNLIGEEDIITLPKYERRPPKLNQRAKLIEKARVIIFEGKERGLWEVVLTEEQQLILHARYFEGIMLKDLSKTLAVPQATVINRQRRALLTLQREVNMQKNRERNQL